MPVATPVYLDHHASTPLDPAVLERMHDVARRHHGNPASNHAFGWATRALLDRAREEVAALVGCRPEDVVLTSGATEANNLALKGLAAGCREPGRIVTSVLEHPSVREPLRELAGRGWEVVEVGCGSDGIVDPADVAAALDDRTALVTILAVQNEIGTIQPLGEIAALCRDRGIPFHADAAQAVGRIPVDMTAEGIDLLSLSAHKFHGPTGSGALVVRGRHVRRRLRPLLTGGGQEGGLRSGTPNVIGAVGMGEACRVAGQRLEEDGRRLRGLAQRLWEGIRQEIPDARLNGHPRRRLPGSLNILFPGATAAALLRELRTLALSTGSACSSTDGRVSPVLRCLGLSEQEAAASLRICLGRFTTDAEVAYATERIVAAARAVRA